MEPRVSSAPAEMANTSPRGNRPTKDNAPKIIPITIEAAMNGPLKMSAAPISIAAKYKTILPPKPNAQYVNGNDNWPFA